MPGIVSQALYNSILPLTKGRKALLVVTADCDYASECDCLLLVGCAPHDAM